MPAEFQLLIIKTLSKKWRIVFGRKDSF